MTIYYVDPYAGSNANTGLSWPQAWTFLPGNGTAILPGDEIRYAKSAEVAWSVAQFLPLSLFYGTMYHTLSPTIVTVGLTTGNWTTDTLYCNAGTASQIPFKASVTIPANTKIAYKALTHTSTTNSLVSVVIQYDKWPTGAEGQYLKVVLCSDTLGATPVLTLNGPTSFYANGTGLAYCEFIANNNGTPYNLTIGSIAIYTGTSGFTTTAAVTNMTPGSFMRLYPNTSASDAETLMTGVILRRASASNASVVTLGGLTAPTPPNCVLTYYVIPNGTQLGLVLMPSSPYVTDVDSASGFIGYKPIPITDAGILTSVLSFSGAAGNTIKIRGGFNTATDVQDGYTAIGYRGMGQVACFGFLNFANNFGDYLEFENFQTPNLPLIGLPNLTAGAWTMNSVKATRCTIGWGGVIGMNVLGTTMTVGSIDITNSNVHTINNLVTTGYAVNTRSVPASNGLRLGTVTYTDCCLSGGGSLSVRVTGSLSIVGTVKNRSVIVWDFASTLNYDILTGPFSLLFENTCFIGKNGSLLIGTTTVPNVLSYGSITFHNCDAAHNYLANTEVRARYLKYVTFDTLEITTGNSTYMTTVGAIFPDTATWYTANAASLPSLTFTGPFSGSSAGSGITVAADNLRSGLSFAGITTPEVVGSKLLSIALKAVFAKMTLSDMQLSTFTYGVGTTSVHTQLFNTAVPDDCGVTLRNCSLMVATDFPVGWLRLIDCTIYTHPIPANVYRNTAGHGVHSGIAGAVLAFGGQLSDMTAGQLGFVSFNAGSAISYPASLSNPVLSPNRIGLISGVKGNIDLRNTSGGSIDNHYNYGTNIIYAEPGYTVTVQVASTPVQVWNGSADFYLQPHYVYGDASVFRAGYDYATQANRNTRNTYGFVDTVFQHMHRAGRILVRGGKNIEITLILRSTTTGVFRITVPPSYAYTASLAGHVKSNSVRAINTDLTYTFNIAPQNDGAVEVLLWASVAMTLRSFTVTST